MHIPKGKPIHENLKTSYVNTAALLADLQISGFTGYLQIVFPNGSGYIFLDAGKILNAFDETNDRTRRGDEAIDAIFLRAASPEGKISVYSHKDTIIHAIAGRIEGIVVYQDLDSTFTDLSKLIAKLSQQTDYYFYIEVQLGELADGVIYLMEGKTDGLVSMANGDIIAGETSYNKVLELLNQTDATFHVYRCKKLQNPDNVLAFPELASEEAPKYRHLAPVDSPNNVVAADIVAAEIVEVPSEDGAEDIIEAESEAADYIAASSQGEDIVSEDLQEELQDNEEAYDEEEAEEEDEELESPRPATLTPFTLVTCDNSADSSNKAMEEVVAELAARKSVATEPEPEPEKVVAWPGAHPTEELNNYVAIDNKLLDLISEVIQIIERASILVIKNSNFMMAFRAGLLKVSEQYPCFDPFDAEVQYQDGRISCDAEITTTELIDGIVQALNYALIEMIKLSPNAPLRQVITDALSRLQNLRQAEFAEFDLAPALTKIVALD